MYSLGKEMEWEYRFGQMGLFMKAIGKIIKQMEKDD